MWKVDRSFYEMKGARFCQEYTTTSLLTFERRGSSPRLTNIFLAYVLSVNSLISVTGLLEYVHSGSATVWVSCTLVQ